MKTIALTNRNSNLETKTNKSLYLDMGQWCLLILFYPKLICGTFLPFKSDCSVYFPFCLFAANQDAYWGWNRYFKLSLYCHRMLPSWGRCLQRILNRANCTKAVLHCLVKYNFRPPFESILNHCYFRGSTWYFLIFIPSRQIKFHFNNHTRFYCTFDMYFWFENVLITIFMIEV